MQVLIVTGGKDKGGKPLSSTELLVYLSPEGPTEGWREATHLDTPRYGLRAAKIGQVVYVTGGTRDDGSHFYDGKIQSWSPDHQTWTREGMVDAANGHDGVTEVLLTDVADFCDFP